MFFILFAVPFRVHFVDISWKLLRLHIFTGIFVKIFCIWNIIIGLYQAAHECGHIQAPAPKLQKNRSNSDYNLYHHQKTNIWKRPNQDKCWSLKTTPPYLHLHLYVMRRCGRLAPHQPLSVCALLPALREEQASAASWEPRPPFEAAEMD